MSETLVYQKSLKVVLLGESAVGKSAIVTRFSTGKYLRNNATIGAAYVTKDLEYIRDGDVYQVRLEIWDTAGQERYRSLTPMYYRNTDVAIVVFDVSNLRSLSMAHKWIDELNTYVENKGRERINIVLVGNKMDLCSDEERSTLPQRVEEQFQAVSAKSGEGIEELFDHIVKGIPSDQFTLKSAAVEQPENVVNLNNKSVLQSTCNC